jgi:excisionase family DNA binding protein
VVRQFETLLTIAEAALLLGVSVATLRRWAKVRQGPAYLKVGRAVRYRHGDVVLWLDRQQAVCATLSAEDL